MPNKTKGAAENGLLLLTAAAAFAALLLNAAAAAQGCRDALSVCAGLIIPSLFPFFVLSALFNRLGLPGVLGRLFAPAAVHLYGISGAGASALLIGLTGGYPAGAAYIADMVRAGAVSRREAERLLGFCNNSGPAFIVGAVGVGVFRSPRAGLLLYAVHAFAALAAGFFFRGRNPFGELQPVLLEQTEPGAALAEAVRQAVGTTLNVCGFVLCFSILVSVLDSHGALSLFSGFLAARLGWEPHFARAFLTGLLELGSGSAALDGLRLCPASFALAAGLLGWGGLSVHFQTLSVLSDSGVTGALHLTGRLISGSISAAAAYAAALLFL